MQSADAASSVFTTCRHANQLLCDIAQAIITFNANKKAVLSQRWPRDAPYRLSIVYAFQRYCRFCDSVGLIVRVISFHDFTIHQRHRRTCDRKMALCIVVHRAVKTHIGTAVQLCSSCCRLLESFAQFAQFGDEHMYAHTICHLVVWQACRAEPRLPCRVCLMTAAAAARESQGGPAHDVVNQSSCWSSLIAVVQPVYRHGASCHCRRCLVLSAAWRCVARRCKMHFLSKLVAVWHRRSQHSHVYRVGQKSKPLFYT